MTTEDAKPTVILRGITLHRPWPWAMVFSEKRTENRPWCLRSVTDDDGVQQWLLRKFADGYAEARQTVKLYLAIHAGRALDRDALGMLHEKHRARGGVLDLDNEAGCVVAIARYAGVLDVWHTLPEDPARAAHDEWIYDPPRDSLPDGKRPFAWLLDDLVAFRQPVKIDRGAQGLWKLDDEQKGTVRMRYAEALLWERSQGEGA